MPPRSVTAHRRPRTLILKTNSQTQTQTPPAAARCRPLPPAAARCIIIIPSYHHHHDAPPPKAAIPAVPESRSKSHTYATRAPRAAPNIQRPFQRAVLHAHTRKDTQHPITRPLQSRSGAVSFKTRDQNAYISPLHPEGRHSRAAVPRTHRAVPTESPAPHREPFQDILKPSTRALEH